MTPECCPVDSPAKVAEQRVTPNLPAVIPSYSPSVATAVAARIPTRAFSIETLRRPETILRI
jgi:hypothetical protein